MIINDVMFSADLEEILNELVAQLRMNNIHYIAKMVPTSLDVQICCPYHNNGQERRPSAGIRRKDGLFHCFACGEVHTLPEVISHCFGKDAIGSFGWNWLLRNFATVSIQNRKDINLDLSRNAEQVEQKYVTEEELEKYRYIHPYMYKRRLTDEIIELFDVGFDSDSQCITFPVRDINGNCLFIARRSVHTKFFSYPQGVEKPVYGLYELSQQIKAQETLELKIMDSEPITMHKQGDYLAFYNEVIICESIIDALTCWVYGKPAVALNGLGTKAQFDALNEFPARKYILALDMDSAGLQARIRAKKAIKRKLVTEYVWDLEKAKDINDMEQEYFNNLQEIF